MVHPSRAEKTLTGYECDEKTFSTAGVVAVVGLVAVIVSYYVGKSAGSGSSA